MRLLHYRAMSCREKQPQTIPTYGFCCHRVARGRHGSDPRHALYRCKDRFRYRLPLCTSESHHQESDRFRNTAPDTRAAACDLSRSPYSIPIPPLRTTFWNQCYAAVSHSTGPAAQQFGPESNPLLAASLTAYSQHLPSGYQVSERPTYIKDVRVTYSSFTAVICAPFDLSITSRM